MLIKRNLLQNVTIVSCCGSVICFLLNYITEISPLQGIWFLLYVVAVFLLSILFSFKFLRWLLHLNKPIKYDIESLLSEYPFLSFLSSVLPKLPERVSKENKEYDTNELSVITTVLERKLVSSWYVPYVSEEISFPFASKQMLDQMISRVFQISSNIETKDVYVDVSIVLTTHLNKYKKALKLYEKAPNNTVESFYKKSHPVSDKMKSLSCADHCTNLLRIVIKELVAWELTDTPQSELLVRILSKKMNTFIETTLSNPQWLNEKLMMILSGKSKVSTEKHNISKKETNKLNIETKDVINVDTADSIIIDNGIKIKDTDCNVPSIETSLSSIETSTTPALELSSNDELVQSAEEPSETLEGFSDDSYKGFGSEPVEIKATSSPVLRQRRGRQGRNEVKIYDRIIEGSMKTWDTDMDLQCISVGQDLLAQLDGEMTLSRLWGQDNDETSPNPPKTEPTLWFGEDEIDMEIEACNLKSHTSPSRKELSPKPADALLKDIQTTVNQAKTKIGDLQVSCPIDVPCKQPSGDEAAGMMEGLLDLGIAGLRKGLRFTGLADDLPQEKSLTPYKEKHSPPKNLEIKDESTVQKELNGGSAPQLIKQNRVLSQDSVPRGPPPLAVVGAVPPGAVPPGAVPPGAVGAAPSPPSPEPEYEEAEDLSTSIAKLRCLLQQREHEKAAAEGAVEGAWWEGAPGKHSARPVDAATAADEYDVTCERSASPTQATNNMQRLDRLFARTVTGVFNSIRTAVGAEGDELPAAAPEWAYVPSSMELSICGGVARVLAARRARAHVDAALDSLDQLPAPAPPAPAEPDDYEEWCLVVGRSFTSCCGFASCVGLCRSHVANRILTLLFADVSENLINIWLDNLTAWLKAEIFSTFEEMSREDVQKNHEKEVEMRGFDVKETTAAVMEKFSGLKYIFGEEALSEAVELVVQSFTNQEVNKDVIYRVLDLIVLHFKTAAGARNTSFDVN